MDRNRIKERCQRIRFAGLDEEDHTLRLLDDGLNEDDMQLVYSPRRYEKSRPEISSLPRVEPANYADLFWLLAALGVVGLVGVMVWVCFNWRW